MKFKVSSVQFNEHGDISSISFYPEMPNISGAELAQFKQEFLIEHWGLLAEYREFEKQRPGFTIEKKNAS